MSRAVTKSQAFRTRAIAVLKLGQKGRCGRELFHRKRPVLEDLVVIAFLADLVFEIAEWILTGL